MSYSRNRLFVASALFLIGGAVQSIAAVNFVSNGDFESTTQGANKQLGFNTDATDWTTSGYNFVFAPDAADTVGVTGSYGFLSLWGLNNGGDNAIPSSSPSGGNYVAADGAFGVDAISQTISGLTIGDTYELKFFWAAAQQSGYDGPTTDQLQVSLGGQTFSTTTVSLPSHGFINWMSETFTFTADSIAPVLSFLAIGTPEGLPPFALLDGVSLEAKVVPEPSSVLIGALAVCGLALQRRR